MNAFPLLALLGCAVSEPPPPSAPTPGGSSTAAEAAPTSPTAFPRTLDDADAVAAADMDGDGIDEIVLIRRGVARWTVAGAERSQALTGPVQAVARGDIDGDGQEEALLGTGVGRGARGARQEVWALDTDGARRIWGRDAPRNQVADLAVVDGRVWIAAFIDERRVEGGFLDGSVLVPSVSEDLALNMVPLGELVAIGRLYGDEPKTPGDLRLRPAGALADRAADVVLPTLRGVRSLAAADLDGDGAPELLVGDGWHHAYGAEADPRLQLLTGPRWSSARTIAWLDGDYSVEETAVVPGEPARLLVTGSGSVRLLTRDGLGWAIERVADLVETGNAVVVATAGGPAAVASGTPSRLVPL